MLEGDNYHIGQTLGQMVSNSPGFKEAHILPQASFSQTEGEKIIKLFNQFCPGLNEEIEGFSDVFKVDKGQVLYYALTFLRPGCSQMAILPSKSENGHTILARNYDFSEKLDDMTITTTRVTGRYAHLSSSAVLFGRGDGMNECGLAVSQTSAGLPVSNMNPAFRKPAIEGLNFWAVIRSVLENCADCDETIRFIRDMPIAFNINLMAADRTGKAVLIETFDGRKAIKEINSSTEEQYIFSTNHVCLPELTQLEEKKLKHSVLRYELIDKKLSSKDKVSEEDIKELLTTHYPEGLCFDYYDEFFGTLRSIVFDSNECTAKLCFGSPDINPWYNIKVNGEILQGIYPVTLRKGTMGKEIMEMI
ncbi:MAG: C45 family peptidase [Clostridia bacterium]|nr:C45 family peptidase [Clostridia bacterium]